MVPPAPRPEPAAELFGATSRRAFLTGLAGAAAGAVAGSWLLGTGAGALVDASAAAANTALSPLVLASDLYASPDPQRFVFAVAKGSRYASTAPAKVGFAAPGTSTAPVVDTKLLTEGLPKGRGIYVVDAVFPTAGVYQGIVVTRGKKVPFAVQVKAAPEAPTVGSAAPRAPSPTPTATLGVDPICTRRPMCPLHDVSLSDVIGTGRKVAVLFATPALCQSQYCGPVLDELLDVMGPYRDTITFVHVEIYASTKGATLSPTVAAWDLPSEPWLYTIGGDGIIRERLDGAIAKPEIEAALARLAR